MPLAEGESFFRLFFPALDVGLMKRCFLPLGKIAPDAEEVQSKNGESSGSATGPSLGLEKGPVLGERWTPRLNG